MALVAPSSEPCPLGASDLRALRRLAHGCLGTTADAVVAAARGEKASRRHAPSSARAYESYANGGAGAAQSLQRDLLTVANVLSGVLFCTLDNHAATHYDATQSAAAACREVEEFVHELVERPEVVFELTGPDAASRGVFVMTEEQEVHSDLVERNIPRLRAFRHELSLLGIGRDRFWSAYFQLMRASLPDVANALATYNGAHGWAAETSRCVADALVDESDVDDAEPGTLHAPTPWVMLDEQAARRREEEAPAAAPPQEDALMCAHNASSDAHADTDGQRDDAEEDDEGLEQDGGGGDKGGELDARIAAEKALEANSDPEPGYIAVSPYTAVHLRNASGDSSDWSVVDADDAVTPEAST